MAKKPVQFETFLDGLVSLWGLDERRKPKRMVENICYQERVVGAKRSFDGEAAGHIIQKLIRIPRTDLDAAGLYAVIGGKQYTITQAQLITDTLPKCLQLTLSQPEALLDFDREEAGRGGRY